MLHWRKIKKVWKTIQVVLRRCHDVVLMFTNNMWFLIRFVCWHDIKMVCKSNPHCIEMSKQYYKFVSEPILANDVDSILAYNIDPTYHYDIVPTYLYDIQYSDSKTHRKREIEIFASWNSVTFEPLGWYFPNIA